MCKIKVITRIYNGSHLNKIIVMKISAGIYSRPLTYVQNYSKLEMHIFFN